MMFVRAAAVLLAVFTSLLVFCLNVAAAQEALPNVFHMTLEELLATEITTASKTPQALRETAAAVYVITQEDIRRSGVTTIAAALRLAPGVHVGRINSHRWAISIRGFQQELAEKLLVLVDGRSVYEPVFSGVYWDTLDLMLEDIERIEVVRGPGGALWGANAVNGVINIITKSAADTVGGVVHIGGGNEEQGFWAVRYGAQVHDGHLRAYAKYSSRDETSRPDYEADNGLDDMNDGWGILRGGFRGDWRLADKDLLTVQGDIYSGVINDIRDDLPILEPPFGLNTVERDTVEGANILGRWTRRLSPDSTVILQAYADRMSREDVNLDQVRDAFDIDFQHSIATGEHRLAWGLSFRYNRTRIAPESSVVLVPAAETTDLFSMFGQYEKPLFKDAFRFTLGLKLEHNDYTGFEWQPSVRVLWRPKERHRVWAAVSRAVRTPHRVERGVRAGLAPLLPDTLFEGQPAGFVELVGNDGVDSETMVGYEIGYRVEPADNLYLDVALFYDEYDKLVFLFSREGMSEPFVGEEGVWTLPILLQNTAEGNVLGAEVAGEWRPTRYWTLKASYTFLCMDLVGDERAEEAEDETPKHQVHVHSYLDLPRGFEFDTGLFFTGRIDDSSEAGRIDDAVRVDVRLGWSPARNVEISLVGQDVFDDRGKEHGDKSQGTHSEIERSFYGKLTWRF